MEIILLIVSTIAAIAGVTATLIGLTDFRMPNEKHVKFVRTTADKGEACAKLSFTFTTSLAGCKLESIRVPGYRLRSLEYLCVDSSCAVDCIPDAFETSVDEHDKSFSFACFPVSEDWPKPVLELRWKWAFIRSTKRTSLESS